MPTKLNMLKFAHEFELKGLNFYLRYAFKTKNMLAKELFYNLAKKEIEHAQKIDGLYAEAQKISSTKIDLRMGPSDIEKDLKDFFKNQVKKELKKGALDIAGYKTALNMEKKSIDIYIKMKEQAETPAKKKFFELLANEEEDHYNALDNVLRYLTGTGDWLQEDESKTWNWMNI
ncbi:MAG: ferritin family protein [Elusimicrobia bacterium]|nr:ferritin family protein [Candidatus Liberimonas magnetica]